MERPETTALSTIETIRTAIRFELKHGYINLIGKQGDFASFIKKEAKLVLRVFKRSENWHKIVSIIERYKMIDTASRISAIKQIVLILDDLEEFYQIKLEKISPKTNTHNLSPVKSSTDISTLEVQYVKGVGPKLAEKFDKIGIKTVEDLLNYYPRDFVSYHSRQMISDLELDDNVTIFGQISKISAFQPQKRKMVILNIEIRDISGSLKITKFFQGNSAHFYTKQYKSQYPEGAKVLCAGTVKADKYSKKYTLANPILEVIGDELSEEASPSLDKIIPIYPLTEGLSMIQLRRAITHSLEYYQTVIKEFIPAHILNKTKQVEYLKALNLVHFPKTVEDSQIAARRLLFNHFFLMQLQFMLIRKKIKKQQKGIEFNCFDGGLVDKFLSTLPFDLTDAQQRVFYEEILPDMISTEPMHRLLQGDVGCGKTVVAFMTLLVAVGDGYQGALMVPTEILAKQHFKKMQAWVHQMDETLNLKVALLVGKQGAKERRAVLAGLASGEIDIAVGTHALIQDAVEFKKLGVVIVDEQHRFGVKQRETLARKATSADGGLSSVERLFMTATPIPRTLALAMHGDLDMSEIDQLPAMRKPIETSLVNRKNDAHKFIKAELDKGNQAYIVFPLIEESETLSAKAATTEYENLKDGFFKDYKIGLLHGKLNDDDKETIMKSFYDKDLDILVATTVIEVGVDVPDATVILIESANRFGLAQLHQLRGRVGRSDKQSYCLLSSPTKNPESNQRLQMMTKTNNGFVLSQYDLQLRGAGDFLGVKQSGLADNSFSDLVDQEKLMIEARDIAKEFVEEHEVTEFPQLAKRFDKAKFNSNHNAG